MATKRGRTDTKVTDVTKKAKVATEEAKKGPDAPDAPDPAIAHIVSLLRIVLRADSIGSKEKKVMEALKVHCRYLQYLLTNVVSLRGFIICMRHHRTVEEVGGFLAHTFPDWCHLFEGFEKAVDKAALRTAMVNLIEELPVVQPYDW